MFKSGTATVLGLSGIALKVGTKKEGAPTGPLVFYWHGTGSSASESSMFAGSSEVAEQGGIVVSFGSSKGTGGDCSGTGTFALDDFKVVDQIVACAVKNHNIDPKRIYTTGCSAGGLMAGCMAIQRSKYLAATAPNSGGITIGYGTFQDLTRMPAVMTMHGSAADNVIVAFAETSEAYDNYMQEKGAFVINCDHGGGHCGAPAALQASAWQFMKAHPFGTHPSPYAAGLPSDFHKSCKIWQKTARRPLGEGSSMMKTP
jgi:poly(3-hydroxybutyrate) depolymerase